MRKNSEKPLIGALFLLFVAVVIILQAASRDQNPPAPPNPPPVSPQQTMPGAYCRAGTASQYSPGVMERVIRNRQTGRTRIGLPKSLPTVHGYVAAEKCSDIGKIWTIKYKDRVERFLVADCAGSRQTVQWMRSKNILVEVDYQTARRWGVVGRGANVTVCFSDLPWQ